MQDMKSESNGTEAKLSELFFSFAKVGALTFGGGVAMLPMLEREIVQHKNWASEEELMDYYAIAQCTPGIIAVNTATFVGSKQRGVTGGIVATLGVVFPSLVIITALAGLIRNFAGVPAVAHAFAGIRVCVCVLVLNATLKLLKKAAIDVPTAVIFALTFAGSYLLPLSPVVYVILAGAAGIFLKNAAQKKEANGKEGGSTT